MKSMTGYGRAEYKDNCIDLLVEIKSVNNRNLDISAKLPRSFIAFEDALRKCVQKKLRRGRVDVFVSFADNREKTAELNVDYALAESYVAAAKALAQAGKDGEYISIDEVSTRSGASKAVIELLREAGALRRRMSGFCTRSKRLWEATISI